MSRNIVNSLGFCDNEFSYENYTCLIEEFLSAGYAFSYFDCADKLLSKRIPFVIMRHDVDMDPQRAVPIARIEQSLGVCSTFFFMIRNEFYNVFSPRNLGAIKKILSMGHKLGLHFDISAYEVDSDIEIISDICAHEIDILGSMIGEKVEAVSFHRPIKNLVRCVDSNMTGGLPNAYHIKYMDDIAYCSDSRGEWRYGSPIKQQAFLDRKPMHILVHPIWWGKDSMPAIDNLNSFVAYKDSLLRKELTINCSVYSQEVESDVL